MQCENKQNPHDEDDFGVIIDVINFLLKCKDCVVEEFQEKDLKVPKTCIPSSKFMKNQFALLQTILGEVDSLIKLLKTVEQKFRGDLIDRLD